MPQDPHYLKLKVTAEDSGTLEFFYKDYPALLEKELQPRLQKVLNRWTPRLRNILVINHLSGKPRTMSYKGVRNVLGKMSGELAKRTKVTPAMPVKMITPLKGKYSGAKIADRTTEAYSAKIIIGEGLPYSNVWVASTMEDFISKQQNRIKPVGAKALAIPFNVRETRSRKRHNKGHLWERYKTPKTAGMVRITEENEGSLLYLPPAGIRKHPILARASRYNSKLTPIYFLVRSIKAVPKLILEEIVHKGSFNAAFFDMERALEEEARSLVNLANARIINIGRGVISANPKKK